MNRKQRMKPLTFGVCISVLGFGCIVIAGLVQKPFGNFIASIFGISGFVLLAIAVVYLLKKFPEIVTSELNKKEAQLEAEKEFFYCVQIQESTSSLNRKFIHAGFIRNSNFYIKHRIYFLRDYLNFYAFIATNENIEHYLDSFLENADGFLMTNRLFHKNNYVYIIFFQNGVTVEQLATLRSLYICQEVIQEIPKSVSYTIIPVIYNTDTEEYILRSCKKKYSLKPINHAIFSLRRIIF